MMSPGRSVIQKILSIGMLAVFLFASMPHEFVHDEITGHRDTVDHYHSHTQVSHHHTHCKFLQEVLAPYLPGHFDEPPLCVVDFAILSIAIPAFFSADTLFYNSLRGPPSQI